MSRVTYRLITTARFT